MQRIVWTLGLLLVGAVGIWFAKTNGLVAQELKRLGPAVRDFVNERAPPPPPRGPKGRLDDEPPMSAEGRISEFAVNPRGDVDGFVLDDGIEVKVPPHQGHELQDAFKRQEEVRVEGRRHVTPEGDVHLHADHIVAVSTDAEWNRDEPGPSRPGPRDGRPGPAAGPRERAADRGVTNEQILQELRELRRLVEQQK